jgi:hypothetical protein
MKKKKNKENSSQSKFELDIVSKFEKSNVSVEELRIGVWAPVQKVSPAGLMYKNFIKNKRSRAISTSWGRVLITGNILTQVHRDLLDCMLAEAVNKSTTSNGGLAVTFKESTVLKRYSNNTRATNYTWLREKIREIRNTSIEIEDKQKNYYAFNIIEEDGAIHDDDTWKIVFSEKYIRYIESQLTVGYLNELDKLLTIESALLKSIVRFFWTHKNSWTMSVEDLLTTVGYPQDSEQMIRVAKREIEANMDMLKQFGILSAQEEVKENGRVKIKKILYKKQVDVQLNFIAPSSLS